jgi:hypothetical protein
MTSPTTATLVVADTPRAVRWGHVHLGLAGVLFFACAWNVALMGGRSYPAYGVAAFYALAAVLQFLAMFGRRCKRTWALRIAALSLGATTLLTILPAAVVLVFTIRAPVREWYLAPERQRRDDPRKA